MRELKQSEVIAVSGGAFDLIKSAKDIYKFLISDKNPLSGANIGKGFSTIIGDIMGPIMRSVSKLVNNL